MILQLSALNSARRLRALSIDTWLGTPRGPLKMADRHFFLLSANATIAWGDINGTHTPSVGPFSLAAPGAETFNPRHSKQKGRSILIRFHFQFPPLLQCILLFIQQFPLSPFDLCSSRRHRSPPAAHLLFVQLASEGSFTWRQIWTEFLAFCNQYANYFFILK
jgi:hypothetical protein